MPTAAHTDAQGDSPRLIRNGIFLLGIELATKLLGLFFFIFLARFLGAGELGLYAYAVTLANFFVLVPKFGFESLVQREVGRDHTLAWPYLQALSTLKGILALLSLLALTGAALLTLPPGEGQAVLLVGCFVFTYSFLEFIDAFFRALEKAEFEVLVRLWFSLANLTLGFYLLYSGRGLKAVVTGQLVSVLTAVILALVILRRLVLVGPSRLPVPGLWGYFTSAAPFAGIVAALFFSNQTGILILSFFADKTDVGYLAAGLRLFDNLTLIPAAVMGAFLPVVSRYYHTSVRAFTTTLRLTLKYLFIFSAPLAVGMFCLAPQLTVFLFKDTFLPTAEILQILSLALIFSFWNYLGDNVLIARNQETKLLRLAWLGAGIHVATNLALIPPFAYLGACWATLLTQTFYFIILFWYMRRYLNISGLCRLIWRPALAAGVMGLGVMELRSLPLAVTILAGMFLYALLLLATQTLTAQELKTLKAVWQLRHAPPQPADAV
jgi:O-antigen/teichoic acid export membrane protein